MERTYELEFHVHRIPLASLRGLPPRGLLQQGVPKEALASPQETLSQCLRWPILPRNSQEAPGRWYILVLSYLFLFVPFVRLSMQGIFPAFIFYFYFPLSCLFLTLSIYLYLVLWSWPGTSSGSGGVSVGAQITEVTDTLPTTAPSRPPHADAPSRVWAVVPSAL